jgi:16S rRNA (guanine527-N7)-methyltransferase
LQARLGRAPRHLALSPGGQVGGFCAAQATPDLEGTLLGAGFHGEGQRDSSKIASTACRVTGRASANVDDSQLERIAEGARRMAVSLEPAAIALLGRHVDLLLKWNRSINLTAITDPEEVVEKHVLDSLAVAPSIPPGSIDLLDAGSGGGFPGIPLAVARPDLKVVMVDSVQKKVGFLKNALADLKLPNAKAISLRLGGRPDEEGVGLVSVAVARAYAAPADWLDLAQSYLRAGGVALCMLGPTEAIPEQVGRLRLDRTLAYQLPFSQARRRLAIYRPK